MNSIISSQKALNTVIIILIAVSLFHCAIITQLIPYSIAWGGRLENDEQMYVFESISLLVNFFLLFILSIKGNYLKIKASNKLIRIVLWLFVVLFSLNTIGNLFAKTLIEKMFTIVTALLAVLIFIVLKDKEERAK
ncbi:MAG: hypothetical protein WBM13_08605 [Bacteroidia bacterium]